jgi:hypothetical protein
MEDLNAIVGQTYLLSCHKSGFGNYFCEIEILKVKKKVSSWNNMSCYSIKYRKLNSPYDARFYEWYKQEKKVNPNISPFVPPKTDVWVHEETTKTWNMRVRKI